MKMSYDVQVEELGAIEEVSLLQKREELLLSL